MTDPQLRHLRSFNRRELCAGNKGAANEGPSPGTGAIRKRGVRILGCSLPLPPGPSDDPEAGHGRLPSVERRIY